MRQGKALAVSAMLAALGTVLLYLGALSGVLDLVTVMLASFLVAFAVVELGGIWPYLLYASTGVLAILLLPDRFVALEYILFGGYYPILKYWFEKLSRIPSGIAKSTVFLAAASLLTLIGIRVFGLAFPFRYAFLPLLLLPALFVFALYDLLLTRLIIRYNLTLAPRVRRMLK